MSLPPSPKARSLPEDSAGIVLVSAPAVPTFTVKVPALKLAGLRATLPVKRIFRSSALTTASRLRSMNNTVWFVPAS
ncbi:hypothetical protein D3C78_1909240 [compost metagenome]